MSVSMAPAVAQAQDLQVFAGKGFRVLLPPEVDTEEPSEEVFFGGTRTSQVLLAEDELVGVELTIHEYPAAYLEGYPSDELLTRELLTNAQLRELSVFHHTERLERGHPWRTATLAEEDAEDQAPAILVRMGLVGRRLFILEIDHDGSSESRNHARKILESLQVESRLPAVARIKPMVSRARAPAQRSVPDAVPMRYGQTLRGESTHDDYPIAASAYVDSYAFAGVAGEKVRIVITSKHIEKPILAMGIAGRRDFVRNHTGSGGRSELTLVLPEDADYVIIAGRKGDRGGAYALTLEKLADAPYRAHRRSAVILGLAAGEAGTTAGWGPSVAVGVGNQFAEEWLVGGLVSASYLGTYNENPSAIAGVAGPNLTWGKDGVALVRLTAGLGYGFGFTTAGVGEPWMGLGAGGRLDFVLMRVALWGEAQWQFERTVFVVGASMNF